MDYKWKWISIGTIGSLFALSHIGMIGMLAQRESKFPKVNLPVSEYTSYSVRAGKDGYAINYRANDPLIMGVQKSVKNQAAFWDSVQQLLRLKNNTQWTVQGTMVDRSQPEVLGSIHPRWEQQTEKSSVTKPLPVSKQKAVEKEPVEWSGVALVLLVVLPLLVFPLLGGFLQVLQR